MTAYTFPTVSEALPVILHNLLEQGEEVGSRNGRVKEFLNTQITLTRPWEREVLSINRKANVFAQIAETMWVLSGRSDVEWLSAYLPRALDYSDDGLLWRAGYGPRIRNFNGVDQLARVVEMLRRDPLTRQAVIQIWDVSDGAVDRDWKDRACNTQLQFQSRLGKLHLTVTVRSNDVMWGWSGINAFEWSTLQEMVASLLGIGVGNLTFNVGSLHLYAPHWGRAETITYEPLSHDTVTFNPDGVITTVDELDRLIARWFEWEGMCRTGEATPALLLEMGEPLLLSWGAAIAYFWQRDEVWLNYFSDTALAVAVARTPASVLSEAPQTSRSTGAAPVPTPQPNERVRAFYEFVTHLHAAKHASYGNSWKKRGEKLSILANMARKVDRLGVGDQFDSSADTWIDLMVYGIKYGLWLRGKDDGPENVDILLGHFLGETEEVKVDPDLIKWEAQNVAHDFDYYADNVDGLSDSQKREFVLDLVKRVVPIAREVWLAEQGGDQYLGADVD